MEGYNKRFVIPVYQRNYDWKIEQCRQLYEDLIKIVKNQSESHFFGSLVSSFNTMGHGMEFLVIDGQQRLTTVSLLFLAMYNLIDRGVIKPEDPNLQQKIYEEYLVNKYEPEEKKVKLKPIKNDQAAFGRLFKDTTDYIRESNLTVNYNYFYNRVQKQEITIDQLFDAICRLEVIDIKLGQNDNPQLIFESLNSTGLDLSEGDKIRNYVLMGLPAKEQEACYNDYWNKIEVCTKYDVSAFVRDYLSVRMQEIPSQKKVYIKFKEYVQEKAIGTRPLLEDLLAYARRYETLLKGNTGDKALDSCIDRLNRLESNVTRPFFLEVLRLRDEKLLSIEQVAEVFGITEDYLFRRTICELPTNALNKIFLTLHGNIIRYDKTENQYIDKLKYALLSKRDKARFPEDAEFVQAFVDRKIYEMNSKNKIYILERLENFDTLEDKDVYGHCDDGTYSIEHIMPQTLTPEWKSALGDDYERIHEEWLHRIANLTLTAYNSEYSNRPFAEKKTMKHGLNDSGIRMNTWIAAKDRWTLAEIEERSQYLAGRALDIWPSLITDYKPAEKQLDSYTLDDDVDMTGKTISHFVYKNVEQSASSWVDMLQKVIRMLYAEDRSIIAKQVGPDADETLHISVTPGSPTDWAEIGDGFYILVKTDTQTKLSVLRKLFKLYDADPMDLVFYLRDDASSADKNASNRHELRVKYWTYALPIIRGKFGAEGPFENACPPKSSWMSRYFSLYGCDLCCRANQDCAVVEIYIGDKDKSKNKAQYDRLYAHKDEIESRVGAMLIWNRDDEFKSSKVRVQLDNVSIANDTDWLQMANFHATWARKLYDIIVTYLKR